MNKFRILEGPHHVEPLTHLINLDEQHILADQLHERIVHPDALDHLRKRHLLGVIKRHGLSHHLSQKAIVTARTLQHHQELDVFVLRGYGHEPVGLATVDPSAKLRALRFAMPPILARGPLSREIPVQGPEVAAWVLADSEQEAGNLLATAYKLLSDPEGPASKMFERYAELHTVPTTDVQAFTIEPVASSPWVHEALETAGFELNGYASYDDGESRIIPAPHARMYVAPQQT